MYHKTLEHGLEREFGIASSIKQFIIILIRQMKNYEKTYSFRQKCLDADIVKAFLNRSGFDTERDKTYMYVLFYIFN